MGLKIPQLTTRRHYATSTHSGDEKSDASVDLQGKSGRKGGRLFKNCLKLKSYEKNGFREDDCEPTERERERRTLT